MIKTFFFFFCEKHFNNALTFFFIFEKHLFQLVTYKLPVNYVTRFIIIRNKE
jgi:hypothetical protein